MGSGLDMVRLLRNLADAIESGATPMLWWQLDLDHQHVTDRRTLTLQVKVLDEGGHGQQAASAFHGPLMLAPPDTPFALESLRVTALSAGDPDDA